MPLNIFNLPDAPTLAASARAAMRAALPGTNSYLWPNNTYPTAKAFGGMIWSAYQRLDFVGRQTFAQFAEGKYLDWHGQSLGLPRKDKAAATGKILVTTLDAVVIATGATFLRAGDNAVFTAASSVTLVAAGTATVPVVGVAGAASNTEANAPMTIGSGVTGPGAAGATAVVDGSGLASGADVEPDGLPMTRDLSTYRGRILFRKANPAQGGSPSDYVTWALSVPGVTRVFVERRWAGPGTVRVFPLFDDLFPLTGGIPDGAHVSLVDAALQPLTPAGCALTVAAAIGTSVDTYVANLNPNTIDTQNAVSAEIRDAVRRLGRVGGSDAAYPGMPYLAYPTAFPALFLEQAVANAVGVISADVTAIDTTIPTGHVAEANNPVFL